MKPPLRIFTSHLNHAGDADNLLDMTGRCAFAICTGGKFLIRILNEQYVVERNCMFACMPFVNIEVLSVDMPSELIVGYLGIDDIPRMINRWVNPDNLTNIQNHPWIRMTDTLLSRLVQSINDYVVECKELSDDMAKPPGNMLQQDLIDLQGRLIVTQVLKIYFANVPETSAHTHRDIVFQRFMLSLYVNFREHRNVHFYAMHSGVSLKYFSTIIRQLSGASPSDWIETMVIGEAKSMLSDMNMSIKDIGSSLNFPDAPTFTKYFLRVTGLTPKAYRKSIL